MSYLDFGDADRDVDVVFLHANGFNALTYRRILGPLAARFRIVAIDQRGHGGTTLDNQDDGRCDWLDLRDDLLAFLDALGLKGVVLAGHSMGGTVSVLAAESEPERCRRLTLFDPVVIPGPPAAAILDSPMRQAALRRRAFFESREEAARSYRGRGAFKTWSELVLADYVRAGFHDLPAGGVTLACTPRWEASGYGAQGHDTLGAFRRSLCPIDILTAEFGSTFNPSAPATLDERRIQITSVPASSHFLPMERPDVVRAALAAAIDPQGPATLAEIVAAAPMAWTLTGEESRSEFSDSIGRI
jgi:pimeloyl-ACP methyl ester carboxylesterase